MKYFNIIIVFFIITFNVYSQDYETDSLGTESNLHLRNYLRLGLGILNNYFNVGGGIFFHVSEKSLVGLRVNNNIELEVIKHPEESLLNIDASFRYVPFVWEKGVIFIGVGVGYASGQKRGEFIENHFPLSLEYETVKYNSISALTEIELGFFLTKGLGIFISGYSTFTTEKNVYGIQFGLSLYRLSAP
ncbi:MAG: hypothetical protein IPJ03_09525 [Ignavibacteriales bacterium]|nr:hypothetical protein [Ignavibacteriales bacterium]